MKSVFILSPKEFHTFFNTGRAFQNSAAPCIQKNQCFTLKNLAINGNDLIQIGYEPNKKLGETLNMLLNGVINEEYENDKDILLSAAKQLIESEE